MSKRYLANFTRLQKRNANSTKMTSHEHTPCSICFDDFEGEKNTATMDCGNKFHFKCIFKWSFAENGDQCPLCRADLGLPDEIDSSDEDDYELNLDGLHPVSDIEDEDEGDEEELTLDEVIAQDTEIMNEYLAYVEENPATTTTTVEPSESPDTNSGTVEGGENEEDGFECDSEDSEHSDSDSDSDEDNDDENILVSRRRQGPPSSEELQEQRAELSEFLDTISDQNLSFEVKCTECSLKIHSCNFCSEPFCGCKKTKSKPQFKACPFNKFYNTKFDKMERDDELISLLKITDPVDEDLESPTVCSRCFANRDIVLSSTLQTIKIDNGGSLSKDIYESSEIIVIYYNLYFDNSGMDNSKLLHRFPSYSTIGDFVDYVEEKMGDIFNDSGELALASNDPTDCSCNALHVATSTPNPTSEDDESDWLGSESDSESDSDTDTATVALSFNFSRNRNLYNSSFTQYDNDSIFVRVDELLANSQRMF